MATSYIPPPGTKVPASALTGQNGPQAAGTPGSDPADTTEDVDGKRKALAAQSQENNNASNGVGTQQQEINSGGISGFFGATKNNPMFTAAHVPDTFSDNDKAMMQAAADKINGRANAQMTASTAAGGDLSAQAQTRNVQTGLIGQLQDASNGNGPSAAQQQLKTGTDRSMAANLAMAAAAGTPGAQRQAAFNNAAATQDMAGQSAILRANEINAARSQLGQVSTDARGQDLGVAQLGQQNSQFNASLAQDAGSKNLAATVEQQKQKDDLTAKYLAMGYTIDQARQQAEIQQRQFNTSTLANQTAAGLGVGAQNQASGAQTAGAVAGAAATAIAAAASDVRLKDDIQDATEQTQAFLDSLQAVSWDYMDTKHGEGRHIGVLAQDVEKTTLGARFVFEDDEGKKLDIRKALSAVLASLATLNERVKVLEK